MPQTRNVPVGTRSVAVPDDVSSSRTLTPENYVMLKWAIICAVISVIAGALGFGVIAGAAAGIAKILFFIFLVLFVVLLVSAIFVGKKVKSALSNKSDDIVGR